LLREKVLNHPSRSFRDFKHAASLRLSVRRLPTADLLDGSGPAETRDAAVPGRLAGTPDRHLFPIHPAQHGLPELLGQPVDVADAKPMHHARLFRPHVAAVLSALAQVIRR